MDGSGHDEPRTSDRVRLRRRADRGSHDPSVVRAILDAGTIAHVGLTTADGPLVLPMAYGRIGEAVYLHGAPANALLVGSGGQEVCVTVTILDALVVARTPFHNSMNYRSVVVRGVARTVDDPAEKRRALVAISDHVLPTWGSGREPTEAEIRGTRVVAIPIREASAKVRSGDPSDDPDDLTGDHWAGLVPIDRRWGTPVAAADLGRATPVPDELARAVRGRRPGGDPDERWP